MDAVKFLQERNRMYESGAVTPGYDYDPVMAVKIVEEWSAAHPRKTRQDVFLEKWPEANIGGDGVLQVCPAPISESHRNAQGGCGNIHRKCRDCRKEFWGQDVE